VLGDALRVAAGAAAVKGDAAVDAREAPAAARADVVGELGLFGLLVLVLEGGWDFNMRGG
jgi:hypothetical protein